MHTIYIHHTPYPIPSQWDELSARQLRRIAWLSTLSRQGLALSKLFFYILTFSLPLRKRLRLQWFYLVQATTEERGDFLLLVDSFKENRRFTAQLHEKIRCRTVLLQGPTSGLANITFFEFIQAEQYFLKHLAQTPKPTTPNPQLTTHNSQSTTPNLNKLIATLYRQIDRRKDPHADPDIRIPLNDAGIRYRTTLVHHLKEETKLAILMWFDGCRQNIIQRFPTIFQPPSKTNQKLTTHNPQPSTASSWLSLISELSTSMTDYERIGNTNLFTALTDISFRIQKANTAKREAAAKSRKKR